MSQHPNFLSLDEASLALQVTRNALNSYVQALDVKRHRLPEDRRTYLAASDVEHIRSFRSEKINPAYSGLTFFSDLPQPIMMSKNVKAYAEEGYAGNDTLYKVVTYLSQNGASIPPKLYTDRTMQKEIPSHPLLEKLDRPNPEQSGVEYREAVLAWYLVTANSFQYAIRKGIIGPPDELWTLEPWKVEPLASRLRGVTGYRYKDFPDEKNPILPQNIAHMRSWNPKSPSFGLSPIEVGGILADQQAAARKWNLSLFQNKTVPSGAWVTDAILSPNDRNKTEGKINEKMAGYRNAGRVPLLDAGLKWVPSATPPNELDWLKSIQYNAGQLANLYNMAPQLVGDTSATTYNNMEEAKAASYTEAIFPMDDKLYAIWNVWLVPMYPDLCDSKGRPVAYLYYDKETVEVVQNVIQARLTAASQRASQSWAQGAASSCTLNEAREMQGLPPDPQGDIYRFGAVIVKKDELGKYAEQSLQKPATSPELVPENVLDTPPTPAPGDKEPPTPKDETKPEPKQPAPAPEKEKSLSLDAPLRKLMAESKRLMLKTRGTKASSSSDVTHLLWECTAGACSFCAENDGITVVEGDDFPNGVSSPEDCHKFCQCSAYEMSIPDNVNPDELDTDTLVAFYAIGFIASRHDQDVAEQEQADEEDDDDNDYETASLHKPLVTRQQNSRKQKAEEYRKYMQEALA